MYSSKEMYLNHLHVSAERASHYVSNIQCLNNGLQNLHLILSVNTLHSECASNRR